MYCGWGGEADRDLNSSTFAFYSFIVITHFGGLLIKRYRRITHRSKSLAFSTNKWSSPIVYGSRTTLYLTVVCIGWMVGTAWSACTVALIEKVLGASRNSIAVYIIYTKEVTLWLGPIILIHY